MIVQSPAVLGGQPVVLGGQPVVEVVSLDVRIREESIGDCFVVHFSICDEWFCTGRRLIG